MPILGEFSNYEVDFGTFSKIVCGKSRSALHIIKLFQMSLEIYKEKYLFWSKKDSIFALVLMARRRCMRMRRDLFVLA